VTQDLTYDSPYWRLVSASVEGEHTDQVSITDFTSRCYSQNVCIGITQRHFLSFDYPAGNLGILVNFICGTNIVQFLVRKRDFFLEAYVISLHLKCFLTSISSTFCLNVFFSLLKQTL